MGKIGQKPVVKTYAAHTVVLPHEAAGPTSIKSPVTQTFGKISFGFGTFLAVV